MLIKPDKDRAVLVKHNICPEHERNPNLNFSGCTCSSTYTLGQSEDYVTKSPQDRGANFRNKDGKLFLVRCYKCNPENGLENWACAVAEGICAFCGDDANNCESEERIND